MIFIPFSVTCRNRPPSDPSPSCVDLIDEPARIHPRPSVPFFFGRNTMPSERQRVANRRNGRLGGPKTEHGKRRSRRNSLRHGLTSTTLVVLPEENGREYEEILRGF